MTTPHLTALRPRGAARRQADSARRRHEPRPADRALRIALALLIAGAAGIAALLNASYRSFEAWGAARLLALVGHGDVSSSRDAFYIVTGDFAHGFRVSVECTAVILIAPLLIISAVMLVTTRIPAWRVLAALPAMYVIITVINEIRLALIGFSSHTWGMQFGYEISHTFVGSVLGIFGFVAGLAALLLITGARRRGRR